jgi:hypothetical protein
MFSNTEPCKKAPALPDNCVKAPALPDCVKAPALPDCVKAPALPDDCVITDSVANVSNTFNIQKAAGPDRLPGRILRACANQLASIFNDIFNHSLTESVTPICFKQTAKVTYQNDYRPVALTSVAMKGFERLFLADINTIIPDTLSPPQLAYRTNRSTR